MKNAYVKCWVVATLSVTLYGAAMAQQNTDKIPPIPYSMGQPSRFATAATPAFGYDFERHDPIWRLAINWTPQGYMPQVGVNLAVLEATIGMIGDNVDPTAGYYITFPYIGTGLEYSFEETRWIWDIRFQAALRRGGLLLGGQELRVDWRPSVDEWLVGIVFNNPLSGYRRTRPVDKYTRIPEADFPEQDPKAEISKLVNAAMGEIDHAMDWIDKLLMRRPRYRKEIDEETQAYIDHIRTPGHSFNEEDARYHKGMDDAFTVALDGDATAGRQVALKAEEIIFGEMIVRYNRLFGQNKEPTRPTGFANGAIAAFDDFLYDDTRLGLLDDSVAERQRLAAREIFRRVVEKIIEITDVGKKRWETSKAFWLQEGQFTWLALNYGLRRDQYDTQAEWDAVIERLTKAELTSSNTVKYAMNEQFHAELKQMIHNTKDYQVLLVHDFQGRKGGKKATDHKGWDMVTDGYMRALREAVIALDKGERDRMPQFMIFIDRFYYQANKSQQIMTYLENIYESDTVKLKDEDVEVTRQVESAHRRLREVIANSPTFKNMDEKRLKEIFKVHVNVTHPYDPAFAFDVTMIDHRKIAFRDIFEDDPASGKAILTGTGVGESYQPPGWEDRAMEIRGPAALRIKRAARELCLSQGFKESEIPFYLRQREMPNDYAARCEALKDQGWGADILIAMNHTGYGAKYSTIMRAAIYNMAAPGSVLIAIDSLWLSDFWATMYIAAALRGVRCYALAPSPVNAPSSGNFQMFLARQNLTLLMNAARILADDLKKAGGSLHVGLYDSNYGVDDSAKRAQAFIKGIEAEPYIIEDFPFGPGAIELVREYAAKTAVAEPDTGRAGVRPFLHMKTQFYSTRVGLEILKLDEWKNVLQRSEEIRDQQRMGIVNEGLTPFVLTGVPEGSTSSPLKDAWLKYLATLPPEERDKVIYGFTIGSQNQDRRGMVQDGEVLALISGSTALIGVMDMVGMIGGATWPDTVEEFNALFPEPTMSTRFKYLSRYLQNLF